MNEHKDLSMKINLKLNNKNKELVSPNNKEKIEITFGDIFIL